MKRAVVLLSGGLDSTTTLAVAIAGGYETYALSFDYGQRHRHERERAVAAHVVASQRQTFQEIVLAQGASAHGVVFFPAPEERADLR